MGYKTDKENLATQMQNLYLLDKLFRKEGCSFKEIVDDIPGIFHTNYVADMSIDNMNREGEEYSQLTKEEINEMGFEYFLEYAHPYTIEVVGPRFQKFYEEADDEKVKADFQLIKNPKTNEYDTFFTVSKPFKDKELLLTTSNPIENLEWVSTKIERIAGEEIFVRKHFSQFQSLTTRELEILTLIAQGKTNRRISDQLFISVATVKQHRKFIKKKTECKNTVELVKFAQAFDLI
ncbi:MAG: helix-turn-helix transcriptional regulator [Balneola sp.]